MASVVRPLFIAAIAIVSVDAAPAFASVRTEIQPVPAQQGHPLANDLPMFQLESSPQKQRAASLLVDASDGVSPKLHEAMLHDVEGQLLASLTSFDHLLQTNVPADSGGGDYYYGESGAFVFLAGLLGFFPGFGLGHLISGHLVGFVIFLIIDCVIGGVFFVGFPFLSWALWYVPGVVVFVVERIVEAVSAANAATRPGLADLPVPEGSPMVVAPVQPFLPVFRF